MHNLITGIPNINIPLYELKEGELNLPINISYNLNSFGGYGKHDISDMKGYYNEKKYHKT
jgi:hypothetical protein